MRSPRLITLLVLALLLIGAVFWWRRSHSNVETEIRGTNAVSEVAALGERKPKSVNKRIGTRTGEPKTLPDFAQASAEQNKKLAEMGIIPGMTKEQMEEKLAEWYRARREIDAEDWRKPIEFYGKTVDQNSQPVPGVQVHLIWTDTSATGSSERHQLSDTQGGFTLTGTTGRILQVWLNKDGYYVPKTNQISFDYAGGFVADPNNPVVFRLRKKGLGAELVTSQYGVRPVFQFNSSFDGSPVQVDFFNRKTGSSGQVAISQIKPAIGTWKTATELSYRLAIPDGGFVEHNDEFPFEAPESGYRSQVEFHFRKGDANWTESLNKNYYVAFGNPRKYGRIHVETSMTTGTILEYAVNPDGSRYLEPKE
jgi:hypothetical protein